MAAQLEAQLPPQWQLETDVDVLLNDEPLDYVTPDVVVFRAEIPLTTRPILAADVLLVVEAVSRGSRQEDRGANPLAHAEAGIPHFWRIESLATGAPTTEVHEFAKVDGGSEYVPVQVNRGHPGVPDPFAIQLDPDALT